MPRGGRRCLAARWRWRRALLEVAICAVLGWTMMAWAPFGVDEHTQAATRDVIYRALGPLYESAAHESITVVLLDDTAMARLGALESPVGFIANDWPARYADHANLLLTLLEYRPRAIFVDMHFVRERVGDATAGQLYSILQLARARGETEVLIGGGFRSTPATPMQARIAEHAQLVPIFWRGAGESYPLTVCESRPGTKCGGEENGESEGETETGSERIVAFGAYALYRSLCLGDHPWRHCEGEVLQAEPDEPLPPLSVIWGNRPRQDVPTWPGTEEPARRDCVPAPQGPLEVAGHAVRFLVRGLAGGSAEPKARRCPYHRTLPADLLMARHWSSEDRDKELAGLLHDGVVFYGGSFAGMADLVASPVQGQLPGVYLHAMALDNLLRLGSGYIRDRQDGLLINAVVWLALVVPVVLFLRGRAPPVVGCHPSQQRVHWLRFVLFRFLHLDFLAATAVLLGLLTLLALAITRHEPANFVELFGLLLLARLLLREAVFDAIDQCWRRCRRSRGGRDARTAAPPLSDPSGGSS